MIVNPRCLAGIFSSPKVYLAAIGAVLLTFPVSVWAQVNACDLDGGGVGTSDVERAVSMTLGQQPCTANITGSGVCDVRTIQRVVNAMSGLCVVDTATHGLVAAYSFNEGAGTTVADSAGQGLTGAIVGASWSATGKYGKALSFNGSTSYVDLGNPAALQLTGSMTISAWINAAVNPWDDGQIVAKSNDASGWQFKTSPDTGPHTFGMAVSGSGGSRTQRYSTTVRSLNTWYHVAGVYNAAAGTLSTYVNGVLDNGVLVGTIPTSQLNSSVNANIGRRTGGFYFNGLIDEVRIYNRPLSQSEIQIDMNTPIGGAPSDTIPPTVTMTVPTAGASLSGTAAVSASASDNVAVAGVQFLLDGANLGAELTGLGPTYTFSWNTASTPNGQHTLAARVRDASNNLTTSSTIAVTVSNTASLPHTVTLNWVASTSPNVTYNVYRSSTSGGPYVKLNSSPISGLSYIDTSVQGGQTYYYVARAVNTSGQESINSNQAPAVVPFP